MFLGLKRLNTLVPDFSTTEKSLYLTKIKHVAALPGGDAVVNVDYRRVIQIDTKGQTVRELYECQCRSKINALLLVGDNLCVAHINGTLVVIQLQSGKLLQVYKIPDIGEVSNFGSLYWNTDIIDPDLVLFVDKRKNEIFSYKFSTKHKQVHLAGQSDLQSVSYSLNTSKIAFIVTHNPQHITLYETGWYRVKVIEGSPGIFYTKVALVSPWNTLIVPDYLYGRHRVYEMTMEGHMKRDLVTGVYRPDAISLSYHYLWVVDGRGAVYRYNFFKS